MTTTLQQKEIVRFLKKYEQATNSHDFNVVAPLIHPTATYWFTDGNFRGRKAIGAAFNKTWKQIKDEKYLIRNVSILSKDTQTAAVSYEFQWKGRVDGKLKVGRGRGTSIIAKDSNNNLTVVHEHLSN